MSADYIKDSGERQEFSTGSVRDTNLNKGDYSLLPTRALRLISLHFQLGANKYKKANWKLGQNLSRYLDSALRHAFKHLEGQKDERHDVASAWNLLCLLETQEMINEGLLSKNLDDLREIQTGQSTQDKLDQVSKDIVKNLDDENKKYAIRNDPYLMERIKYNLSHEESLKTANDLRSQKISNDIKELAKTIDQAAKSLNEIINIFKNTIENSNELNRIDKELAANPGLECKITEIIKIPATENSFEKVSIKGEVLSLPLTTEFIDKKYDEFIKG